MATGVAPTYEQQRRMNLVALTRAEGSEELGPGLGRTWTGRAVGRRGHVPVLGGATGCKVPSALQGTGNAHGQLGAYGRGRTWRAG